MLQDVWTLFPQTLVQRINLLLDGAQPTPIKSFQLYKTCQRENLWRDTYENFLIQLRGYFSQPQPLRAKSYLDFAFERPMDRRVYDEFELNFRTCVVNSGEVLEIANWSHQIISENCHSSSPAISVDVLNRTLDTITQPPAYEKDHDIEFEDFCIAWKKTVFSLFGREYDPEVGRILKELHRLQRDLKEEKSLSLPFRPSIYLTQTEIDWAEAVQKAAETNSDIPRFPLRRGPQKVKLMELQRAGELYNIIRKSENPRLKEQMENIRTTIRDKCDWLNRERFR